MCQSQKVKLLVILIILALIFTICIHYNIDGNEPKGNMILLRTPADLMNWNESIYSSRRIFNLDLKYLLNSLPCDNNTEILLIVTSYFGNVETRSAMRRAFNASELETMRIRRVFLLAQAPNDTYTTQKSIKNEWDRFKDILQGNFLEAYRNLTYKHMMGLRWAVDNCPRTKYIVKMDDDVVVDLKKLSAFLIANNFPKKLLAGYVLKNMKPKRKKANKWYVSYEEFSKDSYPTFLSGWLYLTNPQTARQLIIISRLHDYFWIDDTLITGILAQSLRIKHVDLAQYFTLHSEFLRCCMNDLKRKSIECPFLVGPNGGDNNLFYDFNQVMNAFDCGKKCKLRDRAINGTCVAERKINLPPGKPALIENYTLF